MPLEDIVLILGQYEPGPQRPLRSCVTKMRKRSFATSADDAKQPMSANKIDANLP